VQATWSGHCSSFLFLPFKHPATLKLEHHLRCPSAQSSSLTHFLPAKTQKQSIHCPEIRPHFFVATAVAHQLPVEGPPKTPIFLLLSPFFLICLATELRKPSPICTKAPWVGFVYTICIDSYILVFGYETLELCMIQPVWTCSWWMQISFFLATFSFVCDFGHPVPKKIMFFLSFFLARLLWVEDRENITFWHMREEERKWKIEA